MLPRRGRKSEGRKRLLPSCRGRGEIVWPIRREENELLLDEARPAGPPLNMADSVAFAGVSQTGKKSRGPPASNIHDKTKRREGRDMSLRGLQGGGCSGHLREKGLKKPLRLGQGAGQLAESESAAHLKNAFPYDLRGEGHDSLLPGLEEGRRRKGQKAPNS